MTKHFNVGPVTVLEIGFVDSDSRNSFLPAEFIYTTKVHKAHNCAVFINYTAKRFRKGKNLSQASGLNCDTIVLSQFALVYI